MVQQVDVERRVRLQDGLNLHRASGVPPYQLAVFARAVAAAQSGRQPDAFAQWCPAVVHVPVRRHYGLAFVPGDVTIVCHAGLGRFGWIGWAFRAGRFAALRAGMFEVLDPTPAYPHPLIVNVRGEVECPACGSTAFLWDTPAASYPSAANARGVLGFKLPTVAHHPSAGAPIRCFGCDYRPRLGSVKLGILGEDAA